MPLNVRHSGLDAKQYRIPAVRFHGRSGGFDAPSIGPMTCSARQQGEDLRGTALTLVGAFNPAIDAAGSPVAIWLGLAMFGSVPKDNGVFATTTLRVQERSRYKPAARDAPH